MLLSRKFTKFTCYHIAVSMLYLGNLPIKTLYYLFTYENWLILLCYTAMLLTRKFTIMLYDTSMKFLWFKNVTVQLTKYLTLYNLPFKSLYIPSFWFASTILLFLLPFCCFPIFLSLKYLQTIVLFYFVILMGGGVSE